MFELEPPAQRLDLGVHRFRRGRRERENLLPVCVRHHPAIHDQGWVIELTPNRTLVVTLPNGEVMTTGPPGRRAAA